MSDRKLLVSECFGMFFKKIRGFGKNWEDAKCVGKGYLGNN